MLTHAGCRITPSAAPPMALKGDLTFSHPPLALQHRHTQTHFQGSGANPAKIRAESLKETFPRLPGSPPGRKRLSDPGRKGLEAAEGALPPARATRVAPALPPSWELRIKTK